MLTVGYYVLAALVQLAILFVLFCVGRWAFEPLDGDA